jgi:hypothetical protein
MRMMTGEYVGKVIRLSGQLEKKRTKQVVAASLIFVTEVEGKINHQG